MGRALTAPCPGCTYGGLALWQTVLLVGVVAALVLTAVAFWLALEGRGRRATLLWVAGIALLLGPPTAAFHLVGPVPEDDPCGRRLDAALLRPAPGGTLTESQRSCRDYGRRGARDAALAGGASIVLAAGAAYGARRAA